MTGLAERPQVRPCQPKVRTPDNRDDVIHVRGGYDQALLGAEAAQRLLGQHLLPQPLPIRPIPAGGAATASIIQGAELITTGLGWWRKEGRPMDGRANRHPHPRTTKPRQAEASGAHQLQMVVSKAFFAESQGFSDLPRWSTAIVHRYLPFSGESPARTLKVAEAAGTRLILSRNRSEGVPLGAGRAKCLHRLGDPVPAVLSLLQILHLATSTPDVAIGGRDSSGLAGPEPVAPEHHAGTPQRVRKLSARIERVQVALDRVAPGNCLDGFLRSRGCGCLHLGHLGGTGKRGWALSTEIVGRKRSTLLGAALCCNTHHAPLPAQPEGAPSQVSRVASLSPASSLRMAAIV